MRVSGDALVQCGPGASEVQCHWRAFCVKVAKGVGEIRAIEAHQPIARSFSPSRVPPRAGACSSLSKPLSRMPSHSRALLTCAHGVFSRPNLYSTENTTNASFYRPFSTPTWTRRSASSTCGSSRCAEDPSGCVVTSFSFVFPLNNLVMVNGRMMPFLFAHTGQAALKLCAHSGAGADAAGRVHRRQSHASFRTGRRSAASGRVGAGRAPRLGAVAEQL